MNISLSSTSYILPENSCWSLLKKKNKIYFAEYNNLYSSDSKVKNVNCEIINLFLKDLIDYYLTDSKEIRKCFSKIKIILNLINKKIINNQKCNFIVSFSSYDYSNYINTSKKQFYIKNIENYFYEELYKLSNKHNNLFILNLDDVFSKKGFDICFDKRNYFLLRCHLSLEGLKIYINSLENLIYRIFNYRKKVLLLDCDNTLWGGIIGEEKQKNIKLGQDGLGQAFQEFQKAAKKIKNSGIILGIVSKNNEEDVLNFFEKNKFMILKKKDITVFKVNWLDKSDNIKKISKELLIGLDSFVFWDDNPIERNKVKTKLKDVTVIEPDNDVSYWAKQLLEYNGFSNFLLTKEDKTKTNSYRIRSEFVRDKDTFKNEVDYLKTIKLKAKLIKFNKHNINRASQMCEKTNQFNFSTKRYGVNDLTKINKSHICFLVDLKDIYGDHGIVGLIIVKKFKKFLYVNTFLMSCRVMGRYLENWILDQIQKIGKKNNINKIIFEHIENSKNKNLISDFIKKNNLSFLGKKNRCQFLKDFSFSEFNKKSKFYELDTKKKVKNISIY